MINTTIKITILRPNEHCGRTPTGGGGVIATAKSFQEFMEFRK